MKIGILGGTFNPIHIAHMYLAKKYYEELKLDKLILIPTFVPPHKSSKHLISARQRLEMCKLAIADYPEFEICDYEIAEEGKSYTYRTLKHLQGVYPDAEFFLLMGADMFMTVQDWRHPQELYKIATLCAAEREYGEFSALQTHAIRLQNEGARCIIVEMNPMPLSSTTVRNGIRAGEDVSGLLHPDVWRYIREHRLYGA